MCGLVGELRFDGAPADVSAVAGMCSCLARRGPDGSGMWAQGPVALGHRRLAVIDLAGTGAQPMADPEAGLTLVFNGCIYNHRELRAELAARGHRFHSTSDTEVVLQAYRAWGPDCVQRFRGMFAFAVAERDTGRLVLVRDRLGIKPLYLTRDAARLRFASTLPALLAGGGVDTDLDPVALHHYFSWHSVVPAPRTVLAGVRKLPPASVTTVEPDGATSTSVYWSPRHDRDPAAADRDPAQWGGELLDALRRAVRRRMVADVPVGVLLSGGFDSSLLVALLAEQGQPALATFSIGFADAGGQAGEEFAWSDRVAAEYGTDHHRIEVPTSRVLAALPGAVGAMSEPMTSHDAVAFYLLSQEVSRHVKVVQTGQGADEVLAGYSWYPPLLDVAAEDALDSYRAEFFDRPAGEMASVLSPEHRPAEDVSSAFVAEHFAAPGARTALDRALRLDSTVMLVDDPVKRVDNMTMAFGLEARVPFLDHEFVELAAACPPELKAAGGGKGVLKEAARPVLPADVIDRPKGYFPVPAIRSLEGEVLDLVRDALTDPVARARGLFTPGYVDGLLADPNGARSTLGGNQLWQAGLLELWLQQHGVC